ncbi:hypothetical protein [Spirillospora albida]|uniref:hypothetical protein n=1 Tax=Spirillospora albida TaxID=58123 RepID=UPI0004C2022B|nr:hypothetical protein [Spirillospora albida]
MARRSTTFLAALAAPVLLVPATAHAELDAPKATKIVTFSADPEPLDYKSPIYLTGRLTDPGGANVVNVPVTAEYSADGKTGWRKVGSATTTEWGAFTVTVPSITRDGYWRARYAGSPTHLPATSWADFVDVKYRTYFVGFNAAPEPVKKGRTITVSGTLRRVMDADLPGPGATVYIYFKAKGSTKWTQMAVTKTNGNGYFKKGFTASKDGTWTAAYKGSATYIKSSTRDDDVDVR